jgi:hypothetical protein
MAKRGGAVASWIDEGWGAVLATISMTLFPKGIGFDAPFRPDEWLVRRAERRPTSSSRRPVDRLKSDLSPSRVMVR